VEVTILLLVVHMGLTPVHYRRVELSWLLRELFDVDEEDSVPTWLSSELLFLILVTLFSIWTLERRVRGAYHRR
jgi:hypothetical protein